MRICAGRALRRRRRRWRSVHDARHVPARELAALHVAAREALLERIQRLAALAQRHLNHVCHLSLIELPHLVLTHMLKSQSPGTCTM